MSTTIRKGLAGKEDIRFYTAASPTFSRLTSYGNSTTMTPVSATHIPVIQSAASLYWTQNTVQRALNEGISRYFKINHSTATYAAGGKVGDHYKMMGFRNAVTATSIQAAASNEFLANGYAAIIIPAGTYTVATPIQLPRKTFLMGNGKNTIIRASSTIQTSRVFTIAGSVGATSQALAAAANAGATQLQVSNGAQFSQNGWLSIQAGTSNEEHQIRSIAGNNLNLFSRTRKRFSTATVKVIYPAEVHLDNMDIQLTSATQGVGVMATYMVYSTFGKGLRITGFAEYGIAAKRSDNNQFDMTCVNARSLAGGKGYGVFLTGGSGNNRLGGERQYTKDDCADGSSNWNEQWGVKKQGYQGSSAASGVMNPLAYWYRMRKPELSYTTYNPGTATTVVTCPASTTQPAEVFIDGQVYRNTGTILGDLSRTKTPATATVGGLDRGPAIATMAYHVYAVPTQSPSATRQWDLMISQQSPATGPTASATFPQWSWLGAVNTGATVKLEKFVQSGDKFLVWNTIQQLVTLNSPMAAQATWRKARSAIMPVGAKSANIIMDLAWNSFIRDPAYNSMEVQLAHGDASNTNEYFTFIGLTGIQGGAGVPSKPVASFNTDISLNSSRFLSYRVPVAGTANFRARFRGFTLDRQGYK